MTRHMACSESSYWLAETAVVRSCSKPRKLASGRARKRTGQASPPIRHAAGTAVRRGLEAVLAGWPLSNLMRGAGDDPRPVRAGSRPGLTVRPGREDGTALLGVRALVPCSAVTFPERCGRSMRFVGEVRPAPGPATLAGSQEFW